ncbi:hypothetical protein N5J77_24350 [Sphingobium yanoikuyae]|uniref:Uncharacterized protein n=1 Tax=Sphingobium yanoikuyae TaxID=13690 RepID=A0AA42X0R3_SPHYA|nr:hypothetical protein [Sphingobium yanoikuyae]MDH2134268.1 hypothetical protein [Sphingobium yanoikuyae]MDH2151515.1 hypothetical protein [Sphingobium yanoikuyae]MDH2169672.1 hypothetical protein [Sphingobium yanoikuyae]
MTERSAIIACVSGNHKPHSPIERDRCGVQRTSCRACGCTLVRTEATRRWYFSGLLGDAPMTTELKG